VDALSATPPVNIVFAGTAPFAVTPLESLVAAGYRVSAVLTQPDRPKGRGHALQAPAVKVKALEFNVPVHQPLTLKTDEARKLFEELNPDVLIVVAYGKILPPWLVRLPRWGALNLHGSLLPRYRGAAPIQWSMANGDAETGVCLMQIDDGLDTGPVFDCESTPIEPNESVDELTRRLARLGAGLLVRSLPKIIDGSLHATPQNNAAATLAPMLSKEHGAVDWSLPARDIHSRVRAFQPWPGARTEFRGLALRLLRTRVGDGRTAVGADSHGPGSLIPGAAGNRSLGVVCGDGGILELLEVQLPNRKPQSAVDFLNGMHVTEGEKLQRLDEGVADNVARG